MTAITGNTYPIRRELREMGGPACCKDRRAANQKRVR